MRLNPVQNAPETHLKPLPLPRYTEGASGLPLCQCVGNLAAENVDRIKKRDAPLLRGYLVRARQQKNPLVHTCRDREHTSVVLPVLNPHPCCCLTIHVCSSPDAAVPTASHTCARTFVAVHAALQPAILPLHTCKLINERAVTFNEPMRQSGWIDSLPDIEEPHQLIDDIRKSKNSRLARQVYLNICEAGLDIVLEDHVVSMFAGCGLLMDSEQSFYKLNLRSEFAWTSLIQGNTECGDSQTVFSLYEKMQEDNVLPTTQTFILLLKACIISKCAEKHQEIHTDIVKEGFEGDLFIGSILLDAYCKSGLISEARDIFDELPARDVVSWTALLSGYAAMGLLVESLMCFEQMESEGVAPNPVTCVCSLKACGILKDVDTGKNLHAMAVKYGFESNDFLNSTLIDFYGKCGHLLEAQKVFDGASHQDVVSWTALIAGYAEHGFDEEVLRLLEQMLEGGVFPNAATFACSLKSCGNIGSAHKIQEIHSAILKQGSDTNSLVGSAVVDMYAKGGLLEEAKEIFHKLSIQDVVSWNTMMAGYLEHGLCEEALHWYEDMQSKSMSPNLVTWACSLKACSIIGATHSLQDIHADVVKQGSERDHHVCGALVDVYASCGLLAEAEHVSKELLKINIILWNGLIAGYAEHEFGECALDYYRKMQSEGVSPNAATYICTLKACCHLRAIYTGREMHSEITKRGYEDVYIGNTLVDFYAKCGLLAEAQDVFNMLPVRDVVTWNTLLLGYNEHGASEEVLAILEAMESDCPFWNAETFACCLKVCCSRGFIVRGQEIHAKTVKEGYEAHYLIGNVLVDLYAKWGSLVEAKKVFEDLHVRDVVSWTAVASGFVEHGQSEETWNILEQMQSEVVPYNPATFVFFFKALSNVGGMDRGHQIHNHLVKWGYETDIPVTNLLMDMYAKSGSVEEALYAFDRLPERDVVSWTNLLLCYVRLGHREEALHCLQQMQLEGVSPDTVTFSLSLKACSTPGGKERGQELHAEIAKRGFDQNPLFSESLLDMNAKCGLLADAQNIFDTLPVRDVGLWNALLVGYTEHGLGEEGLRCYEQMQLESVSPDALTAMSSLKACGSIGAIDRGRKIHLMIAKVAHDNHLLFETELFAAKVATALVDMYAKCGSMIDAQEVFDLMGKKELVAWNALISGYTRQGESTIVFNSLDAMREEGLLPDDITFSCVLTACSHAGLAESSEAYFFCMNNAHQISPVIQHYSCVVDLFCRAGRLEETMAMIESIPSKLDFILWSTMLGACQKWSNIEVGRQAFERLVQLDQHHTAPFVLMFNMYAGANVEEHYT